MFATDSECLNAINNLVEDTSPQGFAEFTGCTLDQAIEIYSYLVAITVGEMLRPGEKG